MLFYSRLEGPVILMYDIMQFISWWLAVDPMPKLQQDIPIQLLKNTTGNGICQPIVTW